MRLNINQKIILDALRIKIDEPSAFDSLKRKLTYAQNRPAPSTSALLAAYRALLQSKKISRAPALEKILQKRRVRTLSGVAIIAVLTKPFPCPGQCVYCPLEPGMPKSYLKSEPAAGRAHLNKFDPYKQVLSRLITLYQNGHPIDKVELIIKGGTWSSYRYPYQLWFISECFRACSEFKIKSVLPEETHSDIPSGLEANYLEKELIRQQRKNETARSRIIGLNIETRPDWINPEEIRRLRLIGCTRAEIGLQHTDPEILSITKRGHTLAQMITATRLLKDAGFKTDFHLMPQLPGSTPQKDYEMIAEVFANPDLRPDMIKIYPLAVMKNTELYKWYQAGTFTPYPDEEMLEMLIKAKSELIPRYCRISRLIRDIPSTEIVAGNKITNLRETIQSEMKKRGLICPCLRCREVGHATALNDSAPKLFIDTYEASGGQEYFMSIEDPARKVVYAFLRLRINENKGHPCGKGAPCGGAFIRELHTYGQLVPIGKKKEEASQHKGLGKKLVSEAEKICRERGIRTLKVISGVGVRDYYRKLGYRLSQTYMVKNLAHQSSLPK